MLAGAILAPHGGCGLHSHAPDVAASMSRGACPLQGFWRGCSLSRCFRRVNVVFAVEVGVLYLSAAIPEKHANSAKITLTVAQNAEGALPHCLAVPSPAFSQCSAGAGTHVTLSVPRGRWYSATDSAASKVYVCDVLSSLVAGEDFPDGPVSLGLTYVKPNPVLKAYAEVRKRLPLETRPLCTILRPYRSVNRRRCD